MNRRLQSGGTPKGNRPASPVRAAFLRWPLLAGFLAFAMAATGCSTMQKQHSGDPLVGEYYPKAPNGQPLPPPPAPGKTSSTSGPFPSATSANSTAAIAANTTLPGGKQLAIPQPNWMLTNNPKTGGPTVVPVPRIASGSTENGVVAAGSWAGKDSKPAAGQVLGQPTGLTPGLFPPSNVAAASNSSDPFPTAAPATTTAAELEKRLQAKGATALRVENVPGGVRVSCLVPYFNNPANLRFHEATAPDAVAALQAILTQIEAR